MYSKKINFVIVIFLAFLLPEISKAQNICNISPSLDVVNPNANNCLVTPPMALTGIPEGGIFTGPGVSNNVFNPAVAGAGRHFISYTINGYGIDTSITFSPITGIGTTVTLVDDELSGQLPIGFNFNFFGIDYTDFYIHSNGFITFTNSTENNSGSRSIPEQSGFNNLIAFNWSDLDPSQGGIIDYFTIGTAPNRVLVVNFENVPMPGSAAYIGQLHLIESTNEIEIHTAITVTGILGFGETSSVNSVTMGIENATGTIGFTIPGRNNGTIFAFNEGLRFIPNNCVLNYQDTITVVNAPESIALSDACFDFGSISEFTVTKDTLTVYNTGCDTLFINSLTNSIVQYTTAISGSIILPADSAEVVVTFTAAIPGNFIDTLHVFNSDVDTFVCLTGTTFASPAIAVSPPFLNIAINGCCDTTSASFTIGNNASDALLDWTFELPTIPVFTENFDPLIPSNWTSLEEGQATTACAADSGNAWVMNGVGVREIITSDINVLNGGTIDFRMYMSNGSDGCDATESSDDLILWYSIDQGQNWTFIIRYQEADFPPPFKNFSEEIPLAARTTSTRFRWEKLSTHSLNTDIILIDDIEIRANFLILSDTTGIINPLLSDVITLDFVSCGLTTGTYASSLIVNSNDVTTPETEVPITLNITGSPILNIAMSTIVFGNTLLGAANIDSFFVDNFGCGDLEITNISSASSAFQINSTSFSVAPYQQQKSTVSFTPMSIGAFYDTLIVNSNAGIDTVYVEGIGIAAPAALVSNTPLIVNTTNCCDTTAIQITIENTSTAAPLEWSVSTPFGLTENFDPQINSANWTLLEGGEATVACSSDSGNAWVMNQSGTRQITTKDMDVSAVNTINFRMYMSDGSDGCNATESSDDIDLQYSTDQGISWTRILLYQENLYPPPFNEIIQEIPVAAKTTATRFRWLKTGSNFGTQDAILIDDIAINGYVAPQLANGIVPTSSSSTIDLNFVSCDLESGTYVDSILVSTNDPLNPQIYIPYIYTIVGSAAVEVPDTCIDFGAVTQSSSSTQNFQLINTGCDTLIVNSINNTLPEYTWQATNKVVVSITQSSDDAEETTLNNDGTIELTNTTFRIPGSKLVGLRFQNIAVPQGAIINRAYLELESGSISTSSNLVSLAGEATDNATTFSSANSDVSSRPLTTSTVSWPLVDNWKTDERNQSPDIASIVQEIINRPGWATGNALSLILPQSSSFFGNRNAKFFDGNGMANAAKLVVEYLTPSAPLVVLPGDTSFFFVTFSPTASGQFDDNLILQTSVGPDTVCLTGNSDQLTTVAVSPVNIMQSINTCCDSIQDTITLTNTGTQNLTYYTNLVTGEGGGVDFLDDFENGNLALWQDEGAIYTKQITTDNPAKGSFALELAGGDFGYLDGLINTIPISIPDYISFYIKARDNSLGASNISFRNSNGKELTTISLGGSGLVNISPFGGVFPYNNNQWYFIELQNIDFNTKRFDLYADGNLISAGIPFFSSDLNAIDEIQVYGFDPDATSFFDEIQIGRPEWIDLSATTGTIAPGDSSKVGVTLNGCNVNRGSYQANVIFSSQNTVTQNDTVPVSFTISGAPEIEFSDSCIIIDTILESLSIVDTLIIYNKGCETLELSSISNALPEYVITAQTAQRIVLGTDDAEEITASGSVSSTNSSLTFGNTPFSQIVGTRFQNLGIPQGAIISNAYVTYTSDQNNSSVTNLSIQAEAVGNAAVYSETTNNISDRTRTVTTVAWNNVPEWITDQQYQTPNLTTLVQEIVNRPDWNLNNAINFIVEGTGLRNAKSYEDNALRSPQLVIEYRPTAGSVLPNDSLQLFVNFSPTNAGTFNDMITINNNASDTSICLNGVSLAAPVIAINPSNFNINLACCDSVIDSLTIINNGLGNLNFNVEQVNTPLAIVLEGLNANSENIANLIPDRYNFTEGVNGFQIFDGGDDMYDSGNELSTNLSGPILYSDTAIGTEIALGSGGQYFTKKYDGLFVFAADINQVDVFNITGGAGDFGGTVEDTIFTSTINNITYKGFVKRNYGNGDPSVNHLIILEDHPALSHTFSASSNDDDHAIEGMVTAGTDRIYYLLYSSRNGGLITGEQHQAIMAEFLEIIIPPSLLTVSPITGSVLPGDFTKLAVEFNSCAVDAGNYNDAIFINSNDPSSTKDTIPLTINVTGTPEISVPNNCLDLDSIVELSTSTVTFYVANNGCDTLLVSNISSSSVFFSVDTNQFFVLPSDSIPVVVTFAPTTTGIFNETLTINSNDVNETVCLAGEAFVRPILVFTPDEINVSLPFCCDTIIDTVTVFNTGGSNLTYSPQLAGNLGTNFSDDFESGNIDTWVDRGGDYIKQISTNNNASGDFAVEFVGGDGNFFGNPLINGLKHEFPSSQPTYVGFKVRSTRNDINSAYVFTGNNLTSSNFSMFYFRLSENGEFFINNSTYNSYNANQWYLIEFKNIDWTTKRYDVYIDGVFIVNLSFRNTGVNSINNIDLVSTEEMSHSFFDDVRVGEIELFSVVTDTVIIAPGDSSKLPVTIHSCEIDAGTYNVGIAISSNDPLRILDTATVNITKQEKRIVPTVINQFVCLGSPTPDLTAIGSGGIITWYTDSNLTTLVNTGTTFSTGETALGVYRYYVIETIDGCASDFTEGTLTINAIPTAPEGKDELVCESQIIPNLTALGTGIILWYDDAALTNQVFKGNPFPTGQTGVGITTYYARDSVGGCFSPTADNITLTISAAPSQPVARDTMVCDLSLVPDLTATGSDVKWYSNSALTNLIATGNSFTTGITQSGTYTYYVTQAALGCESLADTVTLSIMPIDAPIAMNDSVCQGGTVPNLTATGTNVEWFSDVALTNLVFTGNSFATGQTAVGTTGYYARQSIGGCVSPAITVSLIINALPVAPTVNNQIVCLGNVIPNLTTTGTDIKWYDDNGLTNLVASGNTFATGRNTTGVYTYYATQTNNGCESPSTTVTLTINDAPAAPVAADALICVGSTIPNLSTSGTNISWYDNLALTNRVATGTTFATGQTTAGVYTYYVTDSLGGCASLADTVILSINATPAAPTVTDTAICFNTAVPDLLATGANIRWYSDAGLTNLSFTGNTFTTGQTALGAYTYYAVDSIEGCPSSSGAAVTLTIDDLPLAPIANDTTVCLGAGVPDLIATGVNVQWYSNAALTNLVATGNTFTTGQTATGVYTYYVTQTNANSCESDANIVILTIQQTSTPVATDEIACEGTTIPDLTSTGFNIRWYDDINLTNLVATGSSFTTGQTTAGNYKYYVTQTVNNCESLAGSATLAISSAPIAPVAADTAICFGVTTPGLIATGTAVQWYDDAALTNLVFTGNTFATGQTAIGNYIYYVTQTIGCESMANTVVLTINAIPSAPVAQDTAICFGDPTPDLTATGTNIQWYDDVALTNLVFTGNTFATGQAAVGNHTYYATQTVSNCESVSATVTLTILSPAIAPTVADTAICFGDATPDLIAAGINIQWYDDAALTNLVFTGNTFTTGETTAGAYTYYATDNLLGCGQTPADIVTLTINAIPTVPLTVDTAVCFGDPTPDLTATGTNVQWYSDASLINLVANGNTFTTGETAVGNYIYYVTQIQNGCESLSDTITLTILNPTISPTLTDITSCFGDITPNLITMGANITWYDDAALTNVVNLGNVFSTGNTAIGTYSYYVTDSLLGCGQTPAGTVTLTISAVPTAPLTVDTAVCFGNLTPDLTATGTNVQWYTDAMLTNLVASGNSFATGETVVGNYTYYVTQSLNGCESVSDTIMLTILNVAVAPTSVDAMICFGDATPDLTALGVDITWYDDAALTNVVNAGNIFSTGVTTIGTHTYYVTDNLSGCGQTPADTVTLTINDIPIAPLTIDTTTCFGGVIPDLIAAGMNVQWYDDVNLTNLAFTGNTFTTGETAVGNYTYYVTQRLNGCESASDTITLTIVQSAMIPAVSDTTICFGDPVPNLVATGTNISWYGDAALANLVFNGNSFATGETVVGIYSYYVTDSIAGCGEGDSTMVTLTISGAPNQPAISDTIICNGEDVIFTYNGINPQWYSVNGIFQAAGSNFTPNNQGVGVYDFIVSDSSSGCFTALMDTFRLTINPNPLITTNFNVVNIATGDSIALTAFNALAYSWSPPLGLNTLFGNTVMASPLTTTTYIVTGTGANGCINTDSIRVLVGAIGIDENELINDLIIFPNPVKTEFTVAFTANKKIRSFSMVNTLGEYVFEETLEIISGTYTKKVNMTSYQSGVYYIKFVTDEGVVSKRVVLLPN